MRETTRVERFKPPLSRLPQKWMGAFVSVLAPLSRGFAHIIFLTLVSCTSAPHATPKKTAPLIPRHPLLGRVQRVDSTHGFVLIQKAPGAFIPEWDDSAPPILLRCLHHEQLCGLLRLSNERRRDLLIADILDGDPSVGDTVTEDRPTTSSSPPESTSPSPQENEDSPRKNRQAGRFDPSASLLDQ
jgi:hypothetical protein